MNINEIETCSIYTSRKRCTIDDGRDRRTYKPILPVIRIWIGVVAMNAFIVESNFRQKNNRRLVMCWIKALLQFQLCFICMNQCKFHIWIWTVAYLWAAFFRTKKCNYFFESFDFHWPHALSASILCHLSITCLAHPDAAMNGTYSANYVHVAIFYEFTKHEHTYSENLQMHLSHCQLAAFQIASIF